MPLRERHVREIVHATGIRRQPQSLKQSDALLVQWYRAGVPRLRSMSPRWLNSMARFPLVAGVTGQSHGAGSWLAASDTSPRSNAREAINSAGHRMPCSAESLCQLKHRADVLLRRVDV